MNEVKELVEELRNKKSRDNRELLDRSADVIERLAKELCDKSGCHHKCHGTKDCVVEDEALLLITENKSNNSDFNSNNFDVKSNEELFKQALVEGVNRRIDKNLMKNDLFESIVWKELDDGATALDIDRTTENLYSIGYRKQSEGEWIYEYSGDCLDGTDASLDYKCSLCGELSTDPFDYCQHCGAKMKYETTQKYFSPEEVRKMTPKEVKENYDLIIQSMRRWRLVMSKEKQIEELTTELIKTNSYGTLNSVALHLYNKGWRKQSENIVELPCKVGTTLYFLYNSPYADKPDLTPRIYKTTDWYFEIDKTGIVINTSDIHSFNKKYDYYLGETAFLTKQEAEQALAKMKGGEGE